MDKIDESASHAITINERNSVVISGVKKIESFDSEEFLMETSKGFMILKGDNLEIIKLDTYRGDVTIKGKLNGLNYLESLNNKEKEEGVFNRLFK